MKTKILLLITALMLSVSSADAQSLLKKIGKGVEAVAKEATKAAKSATKEGKQSSKSTSSSKTSSQKQSSKKKAKRVYIANENTCRDPKFIDQTGQIVQLDIDGMLYRLNLKDGYAWVDCTMEYKRGNLRGEAKIWATILYEGNVYPVTRVKNGAYSAEGITSLKLSYDMEEIEAGAFKETRLREVYIPSSVKKVGPASFCEIKTLKTAFLEEGVEDLGGTVFAGCTALEEVRLPSTIKKMDIYVFDGLDELVRLERAGFQFLAEHPYHVAVLLHRLLYELHVLPDDISPAWVLGSGLHHHDAPLGLVDAAYAFLYLAERAHQVVQFKVFLVDDSLQGVALLHGRILVRGPLLAGGEHYGCQCR